MLWGASITKVSDSEINIETSEDLSEKSFVDISDSSCSRDFTSDQALTIQNKENKTKEVHRKLGANVNISEILEFNEVVNISDEDFDMRDSSTFKVKTSQ